MRHTQIRKELLKQNPLNIIDFLTGQIKFAHTEKVSELEMKALKISNEIMMAEIHAKADPIIASNRAAL